MLDDIENGETIVDRAVLEYNTTASYHCVSGYELVGNTHQVCQGDGTWSGITPSCQRESSTQSCTLSLKNFCHVAEICAHIRNY